MTTSSLYVTVLACLLQTVTSNQPVAMRFSAEGNLYKRYINFYNDTFQQFYSCLVNCSWQACVLNAAPDTNQHQYQYDDLYVTSVTHQNPRSDYKDQCYFSCQYAAASTQLKCQGFFNKCNDALFCQTVKLVGQSCDSSCVWFLWSVSGEQLVYNSSTYNITDCNRTCLMPTTAGTTNSLETGVSPTTPSTLSTPINQIQTSLAAINITSSGIVPHTEEQSKSSNIPIIVGVVCGVGGALIVTVFVIFLVMKRRRARRQPKKFTGTPKYVNDFISGTGMPEKGNRSAKSSKSTDTINQIENGGNGEADMGSDGYYLTKDDQLGNVDLQKVSHSNTHPSDKSQFINGTIPLSLDPDKANKSNYDYIMVEHVNCSSCKDISLKHKNNYSLVKKPPKIPLNHPNQKLLVQTDNKHLVPTVDSSTLVDPNNFSQGSDSGRIQTVKSGININMDNKGIRNVDVLKSQPHKIDKEDIDNYSTPQDMEPSDDYNLVVEADDDVPIPATQSTDVYAKLREDAPNLPTNPYNELGYHEIRVSGIAGADEGTQRDATGYTNVSVGNKLEPSSESEEMELEDEPQDVYPV